MVSGRDHDAGCGVIADEALWWVWHIGGYPLNKG